MSDACAERLREAIDRAEANSHPPYPDWAADMPTRVLRAIVTELGITREHEVAAAIDYGTTNRRREVAAALTTLLDAAGVP